MKKQNDLLPYALSSSAGLAVCLGIAALTNRNEALNSDLYYSSGIPIMSLAIFVIAYLYPQSVWR